MLRDPAIFSFLFILLSLVLFSLRWSLFPFQVRAQAASRIFNKSCFQGEREGKFIKAMSKEYASYRFKPPVSYCSI